MQEFYEEVDDDQFEIVFVSLDHSEEDLNNYLKESHGDWYHIPFGSSEIEFVFYLNPCKFDQYGEIDRTTFSEFVDRRL